MNGRRLGYGASGLLKRRLIVLLLASPLVGLFVVRGPLHALQDPASHHASIDLAPLYGAARAWFHGGNPYSTARINSEFFAGGGERIQHPNVYFPSVLPFAAIASWTSWQGAKRIWLGIEILAWVAAIWCATNMAAWKPPARWVPLIWGLIAWPAIMYIRWAQPGLLASALAICAVFWAQRSRPYPSGVALGLAVCCKPTLAVAAVFFCLIERKVKPLAIGAATAAAVFGSVFLISWPGSLMWMRDLHAILQSESAGSMSSLPSSGSVVYLVNLLPMIAMFTTNLSLGNAITYAVVAGLLAVFMFLRSRRAGGKETWPAAITLSVSLALLLVYHRYYDLFLIVILLPACFSLYQTRRYALLTATAAILLMLSVPTQGELAERFRIGWELHSHQPLEIARVLLLFHHQALALLALALLALKMIQDPKRGHP